MKLSHFRNTRISIREDGNKLTDVIPWAFIEGCGLNLLKKCVRPVMAIKQEPYFGSVTVHYNAHLKQAENNQSVGSSQPTFFLFFFTLILKEQYLRVTGSDGVERPCCTCEELTQRSLEANSIGRCRHQKHHIQTPAHTHCGQKR